MKPTIRALAELTGCSTATVSRALNNAENVRPEVRRKILAAARETGYSGGSSRILIVCENLIPSVYLDSILPPLLRNLRLLGFTTELIERQDISLIQDHNVAGALTIVHTDGLEKYWEKRHRIPLVKINSSASHLGGIYSVTNDDQGGCRSMVEKLISLGHRKIAIYGGGLNLQFGPHHYYLKRLNVFRQTLAEHGLPDHFIAANWGEYDPAAMLKPLLDQGVTAVIGNGEQEAPKLYCALRVLGCRIPQDVSVMCWIPEELKNCFFPPLSGMVQDFEQIARHAVQMLMDQISGRTAHEDIIVPCRFLDGGSATAPPDVSNRHKTV